MINQANRIIKAFRNYIKTKEVSITYTILILLQSNNINRYSNLYTEDVLSTKKNIKFKGKNEYIGNRDSIGKKHGFGIEQISNGNKFMGIFSHDKKKGWGLLCRDFQI